MAGLSFTLVSFPEMANAANASGSVGSNSEEATIAKLLKYGRLEGDPFTALDFLDDAVKRAERMVAASEGGGDGDGGRAFGVLASCLVARGNALLGAQDWDAADADLTRAAWMLSSLPEPSTSEQQGQVFSYYEASANCTVCNSRQMALSLAYDGIGHSLSQRGRFEEAVMAFEACSGVLASNASIGLDVEEVPRGWFVAGLRGGPPTMLQRARLNVALAKYGAGDTVGSLSILQETDKGPDPLDKGFPQFWDARAAQVAALFGNGYGGKAELEWQQLCTSHPPPPPSVPKSKVKQYVNRAAQRMLDAERLVTANDCEDYDTGVAIPCDAAGIPGLGGSSSPCALYTAQEVRARLWPPALADALAEFRGAR